MKPIWMVLTLSACCVVARGGDVVLDVPSDDRWHYPFNFNPGRRAFASVFGSTADPAYDTFNDRDGIFLVAWRTDEDICVGLPPAAYDIRAVHVVLTSASDADWDVDRTVDPWFNLDYPITDADAGQPVELFGVGFGPEYTYTSWRETSPYVGGDELEFLARDPFPFVFNDATGAKVHVEDSVKNQFTPTPWAIADPQGYTPGDQPTPFEVRFDADLTLSAGRVRRYFQEQLSAGRVFVGVTSLTVTSVQALSGFPTFYTKEGAILDPLGAAPRLIITLAPSGDLDGSGSRNLDDWSALADCLSGPGVPPAPTSPLTTDLCLCVFDLDEDGDVDFRDAGLFARRFDEGS